MTVKECYDYLGANYTDVLERLITDERIIKYLIRFTQSPDYSELLGYLDSKDYENAFRSVHNIKGISMNLGLTNLIAASSELCESLRNGAPTVDIANMVEAVTKQYNISVDAIAKLD